MAVRVEVVVEVEAVASRGPHTLPLLTNIFAASWYLPRYASAEPTHAASGCRGREWSR